MEKIKKNKTVKIIFAVILAIAAVFVISGINKPHFSPFSTQVKLNYLTSVIWDDQHGALIDSQGKRMMIVDGDRKMTAMIDTESSGSPVDRLNGLTIFGDTIYAYGSQQYNKGIYLSSEKIVTYNLKGEYQETLFEKTYAEDEFVSSGHIKRLFVDEEGIYMTAVNGKQVAVYDLKKGDKPLSQVDFPEVVSVAGYSKEKNAIGCIGMFMNSYEYNLNDLSMRQLTTAQMVQGLADLYGIDLGSAGLDNLEAYYTYPAVVYDTDGKAQVLVFVNESEGSSLVLSNSGKVSEVADFISCGTALFISNLLYWLSLALITLVALIFLIWLAVKKLTSKGRIVMTVIGAILLTTVYYSYNDAQKVKESYGQSMSVQAQQMAAVLTKMNADKISAIRKEGIEHFCANPNNQDFLVRVDDFIAELCSKNGIEQPFQAQLSLLDQDGTMRSFAGSGSFFTGERQVVTDELLDEIKNKQDGQVLSMSNSYETYIFTGAPVYDAENNFAGSLTVSCYQGNVRYTITNNAINLFVSLVAIFVAIYISSSAFSTFGADIKRMRKREKKDQVGRSVDMAGILMFLNSFGYFIDSAIVVYVAKSLCLDLDPAQQAILIALPFSMASAGSLLGNFLYTPLKKKLGGRTIAVIGSMVALGALLLLAFSIQITNIYLYIAGKFLYGFANSGFLYVLCDTLPYAEKEKTAQKKAINSVIQAAGAAGILSCLAGGYIAEYLSYSVIYLLGAAFVVAWLAIAIIVFKNNKNKDEQVAEKQDKKSFGEYWKIFLKGPMLMYILFYLLPSMLEGGYSSYLFPMYTASAGISALLLSNISVFAKALVYSCNDAVNKFAEKLKPSVALVMPMLLICLGLLCFFLSPNIYWAIAMMFAFKLLERMPSIGKKMYISDTAVEYGLVPQLVQSNYYSLQSGLYIFQSPILSAFVNLGMNLACMAVGLVSGVLFSIFGIYNKSRIEKKEALVEE